MHYSVGKQQESLKELFEHSLYRAEASSIGEQREGPYAFYSSCYRAFALPDN